MCHLLRSVVVVIVVDCPYFALTQTYIGAVVASSLKNAKYMLYIHPNAYTIHMIYISTIYIFIFVYVCKYLLSHRSTSNIVSALHKVYTCD